MGIPVVCFVVRSCADRLQIMHGSRHISSGLHVGLAQKSSEDSLANISVRPKYLVNSESRVEMRHAKPLKDYWLTPKEQCVTPPGISLGRSALGGLVIGELSSSSSSSTSFGQVVRGESGARSLLTVGSTSLFAPVSLFVEFQS